MIIFGEATTVGFRVLIVDDAIASREAIRRIVENARMEVVAEASSGAEAVERYRELWPDVVTMDLVMPHMNGIESAIEIRKTDFNARIIAISGLTQPSVMAAAQEAGMVAFVAQPLEAAELIAEIRAAAESDPSKMV